MDKLRLEVEFPIDNEQLKRDAKEAQAQIEGVGETAEVVAKRVEKKINEVVVESNKPLKEREGLLERVKRRLVELKVEADKSTSVTGIEKANAEIQLFEEEIKRLSNVGRQGFDDMGKAIPDFKIPTGKLERLVYQANLYKKAIKEATNPELIAKYNGKLEQTNAEFNRLNSVGKKGFDELGNKILRADKDTSTFVGTLSLGVERLRRLAYIIPGLGITGLLAMAIGPLKKLVVESDLFKRKLSDAEKEAKLLGDTLGGSDYKKAVVSVNELRINVDLAKKGLYDKKAAVEQYNTTVGATAGVVTTLSEVEQGLIDNADDYVKMTLYKAAANLALEEAATQALEAEKLRLLEADKVVGFWGKRLAELKVVGANFSEKFGADKRYDIYDNELEDRKNKEIKVFEDGEEEKLDIAKKFTQRAADIASGMGGILGFNQKATTKEQKEMDSAISRAESMMQKIYDLKSEYNRKSLTKDEEELQAVRDKFLKITEEVERFNKNPKNKVKVSAEGLNELRDQAIVDLQYKQETERLKISIVEQKKLYEDYEDYKASLGKEKADERFTGLINLEKNHLENLRAELAKIPVDDATGAQSARRLLLEKEIREEETLQLKKFDDLLKANQTYQDKVRVAIEAFEAEKKRLLDKGAYDEVEVLTANHELALTSLTDNHVKQLAAYKKLFEGIENLSNDQARMVIENAREMLANTDMPEALYLKILALLKESEKALGDRIYDRVGEIGEAFDEMAAGVDGLNDGLATSFRILGDMLHAASTVGKSIGDVKTGIANYGQTKADAGGGVLGTISGIAGVAGPIGKAVGAVASLAKGIVGVFKAAKESRIQAEKELAEFDNKKMLAEFDINAIYRERLRTQNEINKNSIDGLKEYHALLKSQQKEVAKDAEALIKKLQGEQFVADKKTEKYGGFLGIGRKTRTVDVMGSLANKSYEDMKRLYISGQLTDKAAELFKQLEQLHKEGVDVKKLTADTQAAEWEKVTGTNAQSITDSIIKGFENGYRTAADFADDFGDMMSGAARSFFKDFVENEEVDAFYTRFAEMAQDGALTDAQRAELKLEYDAMLGRIARKRDELEAIAGGDFLTGADKKASGMAGSIKAITQTQADVLAGQVGGIHLAVVQGGELRKQHLETAQEQSEIFREGVMELKRIEENTRRTADNTNRLESIDRSLVSMDKKMSSDSALRAGGKG